VASRAAHRTADDDASVAVADTSIGNPMWVPPGMLAGTAVGALVGVIWKERWRPAMIRRRDAKVGLVPATNVRRVSLALSARF
jgi:hypothetical protein